MPEKRKCDECGESFAPKQWYQRFCMPLCRLSWFRKQKEKSLEAESQKS